MKNYKVWLLIFFSCCSIILSLKTSNCTAGSVPESPDYQNKYQFAKPVITFTKYNGLEFRLSEPYLSSPALSSETNFAIALEIKNKSKDDITKLTFRVRLFDKSGKVISESLNNCGPLTFIPQNGKTMPPEYIGVYERFCTKDKSFMDTFGKIEIDLVEVEIASKDIYDKPVFDPEWKTFTAFKGLEFRLSKPYKYLDALSGETLFAIAIEFRNKSGKAVKFLNFNQKVYDDQGLVVDREVQNHNMMYEPFPTNDQNFPAGYSGINKSFYVNDLSFFKKFQKIEYQLVTVDY